MYDVIGWLAILSGVSYTYSKRWGAHTNPIWSELEAMGTGVAIAILFVVFA